MPWSFNKFTTSWASYQGFRTIVGNSHFHFSSVVILQAYISHKSLDISSSKQAITPLSLQVFPKHGGVCPIKSSIFEFHPHPSLGFYTILHINSHKTFTTISTNHWHNTLVIKIYLVFFVAKSAWLYISLRANHLSNSHDFSRNKALFTGKCLRFKKKLHFYHWFVWLILQNTLLLRK